MIYPVKKMLARFRKIDKMCVFSNTGQTSSYNKTHEFCGILEVKLYWNDTHDAKYETSACDATLLSTVDASLCSLRGRLSVSVHSGSLHGLIFLKSATACTSIMSASSGSRVNTKTN